MAEIGTNRIPKFNQARRAMSFSKRTATLKKKAHELQTLCDVKICMVCFGPDGTVQTWPEGVVEVKDALMSCKELDARRKHESSLLGHLQGKKTKLEVKIRKLKNKKVNERRVANWSLQIDGLSEDALRDTVNVLESKLFGLKAKINLLSMENNREKAIQDHDDMELEIDKSSVPAGVAGASAGIMDTNNNTVETVSNNDKDAASIDFQMPPLLIDFGNNWMENDEAYQHNFEIDDWFNQWRANSSICKD
ncbi:unnamed protein product [Dovyalis caffra]|uniref:MADS-box domain-containing protein n=1 Tax=Dovyalis caffra TaxID=77055 RepID=A0AAV1SVM5_9ROSI|nr:unnamed protein product [Dovyalis caffra]